MEVEIEKFDGFTSQSIVNSIVEALDSETNKKIKLIAKINICDNKQQYIRTEYRDLPAPNKYSKEESLALQERLNNEHHNLLEVLNNIPNDDVYWKKVLFYPEDIQLIHQQ